MGMDLNGTPLEQAGIAQIHAAMLTGRVTARALVEACLERIAAFDAQGPALNAVVTVNAAARERADELDAVLAAGDGPVGPLHGIPMVVKDCLETADMPTSFGSEIFADHQPSEDAASIERLRAAGAVIVAKTTLPDWATSWFAYSSRSGLTRNPYDLERDPGGSSGGTGAAVAAGYATIGLGTDCGGSVRLPSSFCNLVGARSTPGLISRRGCNPLVGVQDTIGPMGRSVADVARGVRRPGRLRPARPAHRRLRRRPRPAYLPGEPGARRAGRRPPRRAAQRLRRRRGRELRARQRGHRRRARRAARRAARSSRTSRSRTSWAGSAGRRCTRSSRSTTSTRGWPRSPTPPRCSTVDEIVASGRYHPKLDLLEAIAAGRTDPFRSRRTTPPTSRTRTSCACSST